jgi:hypothetical protein
MIKPKLETSMNPLSRSELVIWLEEKGHHTLRKYEEECLSIGVPMVKEIVFGGILETITKKSGAARLVVVGKRGNGHNNYPNYLGRHFVELLQHTPKPVLAGSDQPHVVHKVLIASPSNEQLQNTSDFVTLLEGSLLGESALVEAKDNPESSEQAKPRSPQEILSGYYLGQLVTRSPAEITDECVRQEINLLILVGYPRSMSSFIETVVEDMHTPVLIT